MSWFNDLSPAAQRAYIAKHPNSKYAKSAKSRARTVKPVPSEAAKLQTKIRKKMREAERLRDDIRREENQKYHPDPHSRRTHRHNATVLKEELAALEKTIKKLRTKSKTL